MKHLKASQTSTRPEDDKRGSSSRYLTAGLPSLEEVNGESSDDEGNISEINRHARFDSSTSSHLAGYDKAMNIIEKLMSEVNQVLESTNDPQGNASILARMSLGGPRNANDGFVSRTSNAPAIRVSQVGKLPVLNKVDDLASAEADIEIPKRRRASLRESVVNRSIFAVDREMKGGQNRSDTVPILTETGEAKVKQDGRPSLRRMGTRVHPMADSRRLSALNAIGELADVQVDSKRKLGEMLLPRRKESTDDAVPRELSESAYLRHMGFSMSSVGSNPNLASNTFGFNLAASRLRSKIKNLPELIAMALKSGEKRDEAEEAKRAKIVPKLTPALTFIDARLEKRFTRFTVMESHKTFTLMSLVLLVALIAFILGDALTMADNVVDGPWALSIMLIRGATILPALALVLVAIYIQIAMKKRKNKEVVRLRNPLATACLSIILLLTVVSFYFKGDSYVAHIHNNCSQLVNFTSLAEVDGIGNRIELFSAVFSGSRPPLDSFMELWGSRFGEPFGRTAETEMCALHNIVEFLKTERNTMLTMLLLIVAITFLFRLFLVHTLSSVLPGLVAGWCCDIVLRSRLPNASSFLYDSFFFGAPLLLIAVCTFIAQYSFERSERREYFINRVYEHSRLRFIREKALREREEATKKQKFFQSLSHEFRTPVHGILGIVDVLKTEQLPEEARAYVENIQESASGLLTIVNDILDMGKMDNATFKLVTKEFDLVTTIQNVIISLYPAARSLDVELLCRIEPSAHIAVMGDSGRLVQVVNNLISNAMKFTESGNVTVAVWTEVCPSSAVSTISGQGTLKEKSEEQGKPFTTSPAERLVYISVIDEGEGISKQDQSKLFDRYFQVAALKGKNRGPKGTGLGLAIVNELCQLMGGGVKVKSLLGVGSTFTATIKVDFVKSLTMKCCELSERRSVASPIQAGQEALAGPQSSSLPPLCKRAGGPPKRIFAFSDNVKQVDTIGLLCRLLNAELDTPILPYNKGQLGLLWSEAAAFLETQAKEPSSRRRSMLLSENPSTLVRHLHGMYPYDETTSKRNHSLLKRSGGMIIDAEATALVAMKGFQGVRFKRVWEALATLDGPVRSSDFLVVDLMDADECLCVKPPFVDLFDPSLWSSAREKRLCLLVAPGQSVGQKWYEYYPDLRVIRKPITLARMMEALGLLPEGEKTSFKIEDAQCPETRRLTGTPDKEKEEEERRNDVNSLSLFGSNTHNAAPQTKKFQTFKDAEGVGWVAVPRDASKEDERALRILVADDDKTSLFLLVLMLCKTCPCVVHAVDNGESALRLAGRGSIVEGQKEPKAFHVIFADQNMPKMDGVTLTTELREAGIEVPVIGISAETDESTYEIWKAAGLTDHLTKPFTQASVRATLRSCSVLSFPSGEKNDNADKANDEL